jgi:hypothetical protein
MFLRKVFLAGDEPGEVSRVDSDVRGKCPLGLSCLVKASLDSRTKSFRVFRGERDTLWLLELLRVRFAGIVCQAGSVDRLGLRSANANDRLLELLRHCFTFGHGRDP